ncbi:hypothetical protein [Merismopedia glauca]|uniref:SMODS and SLOG-associating 2TM effector domain-containing protein n=1 Tax=Merismopedia glauca CCAP 1448/3 TaxID=1296344 RepID=A0A2T1C963_9CYAN|nr:hypothetical protein [Merismopedia glauca]PSB04796.1 hypothetical protein C7B64_02230 [Merismopedia glauca CCAP 1448/3]
MYQDRNPGQFNQHNRVIEQHINESLNKAQSYQQQLRDKNNRYSLIHLILTALATFVAGQAVFTGAKATETWKITCAIASALTLGATITASIQKQVADPQLLTEASECIGKLKSLKFETINPNYNPQEVSQKYQRIVADFPRINF